jgi:hypothetical protein
MDDPHDWMDVRMWGLNPSGDLVAFTDEGWETFKRARINDEAAAHSRQYPGEKARP